MKQVPLVLGVAVGLVALGWLAAGRFGADMPAAFADDAFGAAEKGLADADPVERVKALALLDGLKRDSRAERVALRGLKDTDWGVQMKACAVLGASGGHDSVETLAALAVNGDIQWVRDAAVSALRAIEPDSASGPLLDWAGRSARDEVQRVHAIDAAGAMAQKSAYPRLAAYAKSKEAIVAAAGVRAVGRLAGEADLRKDLMEVLDTALDRRADKKYYFAYVAAIEALGRINAPEARSRLVSELLALPDDDLHPQERIARSLKSQDEPGVADAVRAGLASAKKAEEIRRVARLVARIELKPLRPEIEHLLANSDERVRSEAARALGRLGDAASAPALKLLLDDQKANYPRMEAVTALAKTLPPTDFLALGPKLQGDANELIRLQFVVEIADLGKPDGIATLKLFLGDKSWRVASAAAATVGTLGIEDDLPLLEPLAKDKSWKIRGAALEGMGRLRTTKAVPFLIDGLSDKDPVVRGVCITNLQILSGEKTGPDPAAWRAWQEKTGAALVIAKKSRAAVPAAAKTDADARYAKTPEYAIEVLQKARIIVVTGAAGG